MGVAQDAAFGEARLAFGAARRAPGVLSGLCDFGSRGAHAQL